jgi:hypothetical protein
MDSPPPPPPPRTERGTGNATKKRNALSTSLPRAWGSLTTAFQGESGLETLTALLKLEGNSSLSNGSAVTEK